MDGRAPRRLLIAFNPAAGRRRRERLAHVLDALRPFRVEVDLKETTGPGDAERFAREAEPARTDVVVAAGGDGTVNEVVNGLGVSGLPLGLIPLGTANVLAAEIELRLDPAAVAHALALGEPRRIALGRANGRRFILMAGAGFDAHVVDRVSVPLKRRLGKSAYVLAFAEQLLRFAFEPYRVRIGGRTYQAASVVVANGRLYAGRYLFAPEAALERPSLEVCLFERGGRLRVIGYAAALLANRLPEVRTFRIIRTERLTIEGRAGEPVQGDGDILTRLDARIEVEPDALALLVPP